MGPSTSLAPMPKPVGVDTPSSPGTSGITLSDVSETQPRQATYRCEGNAIITVENMRSSVVLVDPQGESVTLPASPAAQQSRYGQAGYALVLEGREALYMKGGKPPLTCRR